ncbi:MAG: trehalose synthase [Gaiellaceae bacterium]|nr:trehalose synthase [Gaiellaceae bacterium]
MPREVDTGVRDPERFRAVLPPDRFEEFSRQTTEARDLLHNRVVWNVNSTAKGGGVVELLRPLVAYARGAGVDTRWLVIDGSPGFFEVTKRIHNYLHGSSGDGGALDDRARRIYEDVLTENVSGLGDRVREGDVVLLHDPQTAGMVEAMRARGAVTIWRCHVGVDEPNDLVREAWAFLRPYILAADAYVFSRDTFVWDGLDRGKVVVIAPTIDAFTPKNQDLPPELVGAVLRVSGLVADDHGAEGEVVFERQDGTLGRVERKASVIEDEQLRFDAPLVLQVSRWDALKDPVGVIRGFAEHVPAETGAHLVYAGPAVEAVADDPEGRRMLQEAVSTRGGLPREVRSRIHLATLPMDDLDENALMVNALQRHAHVITQKSLAEGFGLTVAEAMWKGRPVVASRVGGIQDQIVHGESGLLLDDPHDLAAFGAAITGLLTDPTRADQIGLGARERVRDRFLSVRSLLDYLGVIRRIINAKATSEGGAKMDGNGKQRPLIVVGINGSERAERALHWSIDEAKLRGAGIRIVTAWHVPLAVHTARGTSSPPAGASLEEALRDTAIQVAQSAAKKVSEESDLPVETSVVEGQAADVLIDSSRGADLLVLGAPGRGGLSGGLTSVAVQCALHAPAPTTIGR